MDILPPGTVSLPSPPIRRNTEKNNLYGDRSLPELSGEARGTFPAAGCARLPLSSSVETRPSLAKGAGSERLDPAGRFGRER